MLCCNIKFIGLLLTAFQQFHKNFCSLNKLGKVIQECQTTSDSLIAAVLNMLEPFPAGKPQAASTLFTLGPSFLEARPALTYGHIVVHKDSRPIPTKAFILME